MKRFVKFEIYEYMDEYPTENVQMWEGTTENEIADKCYEYAEKMTANYSGGPTVFKGIMDEKNAQQWLFNKITEEIEKYHDADTIEQIQRMCKMYMESYKL